MDRKTVYPILLGLILVSAAYAGVAMLPRGPAEFAYLPFYPHLLWSAMRGFTAEQLGGHLLRIFLATPGMLLICYGLGRLAVIRLPREPITGQQLQRLALLAAGLCLLFMVGANFLLYSGHALIDDELTYRLQARLLADGRLGAALPQLVTIEPFTIQGVAGFTGKYLPGEPLVQIPGMLLGYPGLLHLLLAMLTLFCIYRMVALLADGEAAAWATILLAISPTFLLTTPTGQSPPTELFCLSLAGLGFAKIRQQSGAAAGAWLLATGIGFGMLVRPQAAMPVGTVLVAVAGLRLLRGRRWIPLALLLGLLTLWAAALLAYNKAVTGAFATLPWSLHPDSEHYGFGKVWEGGDYAHSLLRGLENMAVVGVRFNAWWLGWPSSLVLIYFWLRRGLTLGKLSIWLWASGALLLFEFFYYSTGVSDTGPVYHYELLLTLSVVGGLILRDLFKAAPRRTLACVAAHILLGTVPFMALEIGRINRLVHLIHDDADRAMEVVKKPALLLHEQDCTEVIRSGWIFNSFPRQLRSPSDPVVTYPRPPWGLLPQYLKLYKDRSCWYYHVDPTTRRHQIMPCKVALPLLRRPMKLSGPCLRFISTAEKMGWFDPAANSQQRWRQSK